MAILPRDGGPQTGASGGGSDLREAGHRLIADRGWAVFLEREGTDGVRRPFPLCAGCREAGADHNRELCECLTCHGFYAAARAAEAWDRLCDAALPAGATHLCVRTGRASGIFVVDLDARDNGPQTWHEWEQSHPWAFPETRRQRTRSGGFHLIYGLPAGVAVGSHNRVAPGMDIKGDGGLVVVAPSPGYAWVPGSGDVTIPDPEHPLVSWAVAARGSQVARRRTGGAAGRGGVAGLDVAGAVPAGARDEYFNTLCFQLRKSGASWDEATTAARVAWERVQQPEGDVFRWEWVLYKLERVWHTVEPDPDVVAGRRWYRSVTAATTGVTPQIGETRRVGNVTLTGRRSPRGGRP